MPMSCEFPKFGNCVKNTEYIFYITVKADGNDSARGKNKGSPK